MKPEHQTDIFGIITGDGVVLTNSMRYNIPVYYTLGYYRCSVCGKFNYLNSFDKGSGKCVHTKKNSNSTLEPINRLTEIRSRIVDPKVIATEFYGKIKDVFKKNLSLLKYLEIMGPVSSPIFKIKNNYRTRLLLRSKNNLFVQKHIAKILKKINLSKKIKLTVDVDPQNFS